MPSRHETRTLRNLWNLLENCEHKIDAEDIGEAIVGITRNIIQRTPVRQPSLSTIETKEKNVLRDINNRFDTGEKIPAIKWYRNEVCSTLKEAKDAVETLDKFKRTY